jgi:hypothetical protein
VNLPEGWTIEIQLEKGVNLFGLFPPNGARIDFDTTGATMTDQMLKAIGLAKASRIVTQGANGLPAKVKLHSKHIYNQPSHPEPAQSLQLIANYLS